VLNINNSCGSSRLPNSDKDDRGGFKESNASSQKVAAAHVVHYFRQEQALVLEITLNKPRLLMVEIFRSTEAIMAWMSFLMLQNLCGLI